MIFFKRHNCKATKLDYEPSEPIVALYYMPVYENRLSGILGQKWLSFRILITAASRCIYGFSSNPIFVKVFNPFKISCKAAVEDIYGTKALTQEHIAAVNTLFIQVSKDKYFKEKNAE